MDILCVSGTASLRTRDTARAHHPSRELVAKVAPEFAARGHEVRWLCLLDDDADVGPSDVAGVAVETCVAQSHASPFRDVLAPISSIEAETVLQKMLRARPADIVHVFGFGTPGGTQLPWVAERLGARPVISADTLAAICHRGTLVDELGAECEQFDDAARCTACCLTADGRVDALGGVAAWLGRRARCLGDASPWPDRSSFLSRLDLVVGSALLATPFFVEDEAAVAHWRKLGVSKRALVISVSTGEDQAATLLDRYGCGAVSRAMSSR